MDQILFETILQDTFLKSLALKRVAGLKDCLLNKVFSQIYSGGDPEITTWVMGLNQTVFAGITPQNIYSVFDRLEKDIKAIEPLILYLPYELPKETVAEIGQKLRTDYGDKFLMDIQIDPNLVAGAALSYKGIYKDSSIKQRLTDNKKAILAIFRKYIKH